MMTTDTRLIADSPSQSFSPRNTHIRGDNDASFSSSPSGFPLSCFLATRNMPVTHLNCDIITAPAGSTNGLWRNDGTFVRNPYISRADKPDSGFWDVIWMCLTCDLSLPRLLSLEGPSVDCRWASRAVWRDQTEQRQPLRLCTYRSVLWVPDSYACETLVCHTAVDIICMLSHLLSP